MIRKIEVSPQQGDMFSGIPSRLETDPHFPTLENQGVYVSLEERNKALQSALTWLGRQASSASFREIGRQQAEGRRTPAVRAMERRYTQEELEEKLDDSESAKEGVEKAMVGQLKKAFGYDELIRSDLFPEITEEKVNEAFIWGGQKTLRRGSEPGYREGKKEFEARFKGSNNSLSRQSYRRKLKRQATKIKKAQSPNSRVP
jgi:hypothetical protein